MASKITLVSAAVIKKDDLILIAQRQKDSFLEPNKWEFPGGKIEFLESPEECLIREIKEEINIDIKIKNLMMVNSHIYEKAGKKYHIVLLGYLCDLLSHNIKHLEVQNTKWVRKEELPHYNFAAADIPFVKKLTRD